MDENKKEGISVKEIELFARKHSLEGFFCLLFLLAAIFGSIGHFHAMWSVLFGAAGVIVSILLPSKSESLLKRMFNFAFKQDKVVQIVLGVVSLIFAIFLAPLVFFITGCFGGGALYQAALNSSLKN